MFKKILLVLVLAVVAALGWAWYSMNDLVKDAVNTHGPDTVNVPLRLESVNLSPFSGEASLGGLTLGQPEGWGDGNMVSLENFSMKIRPETVTGNHIIIDDISLDAPFLFVRVDGKQNNFQTFADNLGVTPAEDTGPSDMTLTIHRIAITKPVLQLEVKGLGLADGTIELADIELTNLGTDEKGQTPEEIARHISDALKPQIMKAITSTQGRNLLKKLTGGEGDTESSVGDTLKKGLSGLLGKKKKEEQESGDSEQN